MLEHKNSLTTDAYAVWEPKWQAILSEAPWQQWIQDDDFFDCKDYFLERMHSWIIENDLNTINVTSIEPFRFYRKDSII